MIETITPKDETEKAQANARLVSAAPDLLAACKAALMRLRVLAFTDNTSTVEKLKAAIAKAVGSDD